MTTPGRGVAFESVDIRPRVSGVIAEIVYEPGQRVEKGDVLFRIDGDTLGAELAAAEANVTGAEASLANAERTLERYRKLLNTAVTEETLQTAEVTVRQAEATLGSAKAARDLAQLNYDRTEIKSPIAGIPDVPAVSVGAVVTANQTTALTTIVRVDPIYVDVEESAKRVLEVRARVSEGTLARGKALDVELLLENGALYASKGTLVSPGFQVSTSTGTRDFRFRFDNPDRLILPGQFLRVEITLGTTDAILVPQIATARAGDGTLTAFVAEEGVARSRALRTQGTYQNAWVVTEGVEAGDKLIVDGLSNLRDGAEIAAVPVTIAADGVVREATPDVAPSENSSGDSSGPSAASGDAAQSGGN
ncbi:efflux RND transporter periplasmic adaptor subunit [Rhodobacteraceae bacterium 10Alg 79]|uniref:Efflux RND transporter periplasmic adaptor subunit n=1 Tax=Rhodalgimonas zhirmunskyi TaxID=2964767 RepID=A0AAJ1UGM1_9RHOB|nr:efflux RND transporter periplasmic adaptor subunit [Rhodoalgimonas zhirmunskyi]